MALFEIHGVDESIKALPTVGEASGSVASFDTDMTENLVSVIAEISASATKCYLANMSDITNKAYFEGLLNGTCGFVDLGSASYQYSSNTKWFYSSVINSVVLRPNNNDEVANIISKMYSTYTRNELIADDTIEGIAVNTSGTLQIRNLSYTDPADFKTAMSGVYLIYKLATPTTPTITASDFNTLLNAFNISGWCYEYDFGETVSSGATIECVSGTLTRNDDSIKSVGGNVLSALTDNNIFASTGDVEVNYILSVGKAIS